MYQIFLVEDETNLSRIITSYLEKEGWEVKAFHDGNSASKAISDHPHLWILDIMLPGIDGYQLLRSIKQATPSVPVIFISARDEDLDRIIGLEMGSDDYLAKPFLPRELVIRVRRLLERAYRTVQPNDSIIRLEPYLLDTNKRLIFKGEERIGLTTKEYDLVMFFAQHKGQALSREQIINHVWADEFVGDRSVDDLVRRLRRKMGELRIETLYGFGYRITDK